MGERESEGGGKNERESERKVFTNRHIRILLWIDRTKKRVEQKGRKRGALSDPQEHSPKGRRRRGGRDELEN